MTKKQRKEAKKGLRSAVALAALQRSGAGAPMGDRRLRRKSRRSWRKEVECTV